MASAVYPLKKQHFDVTYYAGNSDIVGKLEVRAEQRVVQEG